MDLLYSYKEAIVIIVLFIIIIYLVTLYYSLHESMISGMWQASTEFCDSAGIDNMLLKISDKHDGIYTACLMITDGNRVAVDETFDISIGYTLPKKIITTTITMDRDIDLIPESVQCVIDMTNGVMVWKDADTEEEYGRFQRMYI